MDFPGIDLYKSSQQEHKDAHIEHVKRELALAPELLDSLLEYLYDKAYVKAEAEEYKKSMEAFQKSLEE